MDKKSSETRSPLKDRPLRNHHSIFAGDNGRVLGYDSQHGRHHRHYLGTVTEIAFESFEEIEALFEGELHQLLKRGSL